MGLSATDFTISGRVRFTIGYRIGLAILVAAASYLAWLVWSVSSATYSIAALFVDRESRTILDSPLQRFGDTWQWVTGACALLFIVVMLRNRGFVAAASSAWWLSLAGLVVAGWVHYGFTWVSIPILLVGTFVSVYGGFAARAA